MIYLLTVTQVELPIVQFPTATSDTKSFNTSWLEVILSSKNEPVLMRDLCDLTIHSMFDTLWASMKLDSKQSIAWNNSGHEPSW